MALAYYISVFFCLACCVSADDWDDFANNLATDLAPLITLFGEQITRQCMSELISTLDDFIFALAPLGVLTAVVSVIRVCGNSTLRAIIGRAQEDPASSEKEILSCVSDSTAEIFTESGVARITGNPKILEIVADESQAQSGVVTIRRVSEVAGKTWTDLEKDAKLPNLSLNKGIRRRAPFWFHLAATFGVALQLSIIIYAALTVMYWPQAFLKNGGPVDSYAFPMFVLGTTLLTLGMFLCAVLIERHSKKHIFTLPEENRVYWIQPGNQTVGDQKFPSFVGRTDKGVYFIRSVRDQSPNDVLNVGRGMELMFVVCLTMTGFVIQFVGIRGLHSSVILAQLGATMVMTLVRTGLRAERMQEGDNMLKDDQDIVSSGEHELDWLAFHLFNIRSFSIHPSYNLHREGSQLQPDSMIGGSITTREKLRKFAGSDWVETSVRTPAQSLGKATRELMRMVNSWCDTKVSFFDISILIGIQKDDRMQEVSENWHTRLSVDTIEDLYFWEAILSLYVWSLKSQNRILSDETHTNFFRPFRASGRSSHQARLLYQLWTNEKTMSEQDRRMVTSFLSGCQTFGIPQYHTTNTVNDDTVLVAVPSDLYLLAAQDIFSHIVHSVLERIKELGSITRVIGNNRHNYRVFNDHVEALARTFHESGLGTTNEGLLCILPVLADRNLLPEIPHSSFEACQYRGDSSKHRDRNELYLNYDELVTISEWLCTLADYDEIEHLLAEYGYICLNGLMPMLRGIDVEGVAIERLVAIMKADHNLPITDWISDYVNNIASAPSIQWQKGFQRQISWLTLRLTQYQALYDWDQNTARKLNRFQEILGPTYTLRETYEDPEAAALSEETLCHLWFDSKNGTLREGVKEHELVIDWLLENDFQTILNILLKRLTDIWSWTRNCNAMIELVQYAVTKGYEKVIFCISRDIEKTIFWESTIEILARVGDVQTMEAFLARSRYAMKRRAHEIALLVAAGHRQIPLLEFMLRTGVDIDMQDEDGETALMKAAMQNDTESIRLLISHGANLEIQNNFLDTALILAAGDGHQDAVKILLEMGSDVNAIGQNGRTALIAAVRRNNLETSRVLLDHGADVHIKESYGSTALDLSIFVDENGRMAEVQALLERAGSRQLVK